METLTSRLAASTVSTIGTAIVVATDLYSHTPMSTSESTDLAKAMLHLEAARKLLARVAGHRAPTLYVVPTVVPVPTGSMREAA